MVKMTNTEQERLLYLLLQEDREKVVPILKPLWQPMRYKMIEGGRGSGKSHAGHKIPLIRASKDKLKILGCREIQSSIKESSYEMIGNLIELIQYPGWKDKTDEFYNTVTGSRIIFKGLKDIRAARSMMSYEGIDICIVEQAESVSEDSWIILTPTIRKDGSEIWAIFNPYEEFDPVTVRFCNGNRNDVMHIKCNWRDNPWFPEVLEKERIYDKETDYDLYLHVWEGQPIAQIEKAAIPRALVERAVQRRGNPAGKKVIAADIARYGGDLITFYERKGWAITKTKSMRFQDLVTTANRLFDFAGNDKYCPYHVDVGGLGAGISDILRQQKECENIVEFNYNSTSVKKKKKYKNIITEMYFDFADLLKKEDISLPDIKELRQDLTGRKYNYGNDEYSRKIIEPKDKFKERYKRSPDHGDACLMCFYEPSNQMKMSPETKAMLKKRQQEITRRNEEAFIF